MTARDHAASVGGSRSAFPQPLPRPVAPRPVETPPEPRDDLADSTSAAPSGHEVSTKAPQRATSGFEAVNMQEMASAFGYNIWPPDTMGAVGPEHFLQVINGAVALYAKTNGARLSFVTLESFFSLSLGGTNYPRTGIFDTRVLYDRPSGRWFASALERGKPDRTCNHALLAVSASSDPAGGWFKYVIGLGQPNQGSITYFSDFDTLGVDANGVYLAARIYPSLGLNFARIAALPKAPLLTNGPATAHFFGNLTSVWSVPQPAHNLDPISASAPAWLVASAPSGNNRVMVLTITWGGGTPTLAGPTTVTTPSYGDPLRAPAFGSPTNLDIGDDRLAMAVIRNNQLWTCRNVGVNVTGGATSADRTGCEWIQLNLSGTSASLAQSGRVYDKSASNPRFYYFPSIMVSGQGHAVMGFSGSSATEFAGGYFTGRLTHDPAGLMGAVELLKAGEAPYTRLDYATPPRNRWGDYSYTTLDPNDDMTLWTIQEYAENISADCWGTYVAQLLAPPPALDILVASGRQAETNLLLNLTGAGFYDPGTSFSNRLQVVLTCGAPNGVTNYSVSFLHPTNVQVRFDLAPAAAPGPRDIVLTNPDGQSVTVPNAFTVVPLVADLAVAMTVSTNLVNAGSEIIFHFTVTNLGPDTAYRVVLTDVIPAELSLSSVTTSQGACTLTNGIVTCDLGAMTNEAQAFVILTATGVTGGAFTNVATLSSVTGDPDAANNTASITAIVDAAPTFSSLADLMMNEDSPANTLPFTVSDAEAPAEALTVSGWSSNTNLLSDADLLLSGSGSQRTLTLRPALGQSGTSTITLIVSDDRASTSASFRLTVRPVNDPPTLDPLTNLTVLANSGPHSVRFDGLTTGAADEIQALTVTAVSSDPSLVFLPAVDYTSPGNTGTLTFTPATNRSGSAVITVTAQDDGGTAYDGVDTVTQQFTVTVQPVVDLALTQSAAPESALVGGLVTCTLIISNLSPFTGSAVVLTNAVPAGAEFVSATPSQGRFANDGTAILCELGSLASNAAATVALVFMPTNSGLFTNTAVISATELDPNLANNTASMTVDVRDDSDRDGMPDDFEVAHDFNPLDPADAAQDADGDGLSNLQECQAGTNPRDRASCLRFMEVRRRGDDLVLGFSSVAGKRYRVELGDVIPPVSWQVLKNGVPGRDGSVEVLDVGGATNVLRLYRVVLEP